MADRDHPSRLFPWVSRTVDCESQFKIALPFMSDSEPNLPPSTGQNLLPAMSMADEYSKAPGNNIPSFPQARSLVKPENDQVGILDFLCHLFDFYYMPHSPSFVYVAPSRD